MDLVETNKHQNCHRHQFLESRRQKKYLCFNTDACALGVFQLYSNILQFVFSLFASYGSKQDDFVQSIPKQSRARMAPLDIMEHVCRDVDVLRLVANHKGERVNYPTQKSYFKSKIEFLFGLQEVSILSPQCGISLGDALATQHVQGACGNLSCLFFFGHAWRERQ